MKKQGFTLAEALITLAILGVIAAVGIPQVVSMAQKHQSEAMVSKIVYQTELGIQKMFQDYNAEKGGMSQVNKILLVKNWDKKLAQVFHLTEKSNKVALYDSVIAPAYAASCTNTHNENNSTWTCDYESNEYGDHYKSHDEDIFYDNGSSSQHWESTSDLVDYVSNVVCDAPDRYTQCQVCTRTFTAIWHNSWGDDKSTSVETEKKCPKPKQKDPEPEEPPVTPEEPPVTPEEPPVTPEEPSVTPTDPIADIPEPQGHEPVAGFDKVYHVYGLPAEVRMIVFNTTLINSFNPNSKILNFYIDTNGFDKKPNKPGVDRFNFSLTNAGKMIPLDDATKAFVRNGYKIK